MSAAYLARITGDVRLARPMKIVIDCGNGVAGGIAPQLFRALGCELVELFCEVDGNFPNHHPDPSKPENLQDVIRALRAPTPNSASLSTATATASASSPRTARSSTRIVS
jgi:phosphomannomutase/phosphoglucomutase